MDDKGEIIAELLLALRGTRYAVCDASGRFVLEGLREGTTYELQAREGGPLPDAAIATIRSAFAEAESASGEAWLGLR